MKKLLLLLLATFTLLRAESRREGESLAALQAGMAAGRVTAEQLTQEYLARIAALDRAGPRLNAVLELNPDAPALARALDAERRAGRVRGPLHGIPVLLKDNIATADRMETTAGSLALVGSPPPRDAGLVERLRAAGAVILGKTNLSEWANFRGDKSTSGWSGRGGLTRHPHALDRNTSGSSSGSAAAVAAGLCAVAVGTETDGSIVSPASVCGIVGVKPTVGLVSRSGVIPISASQDTAGPMARTVADAQQLLAALAGPDERDAATRAIPAGLPAALAAPLPPHALRGARLGVVRGPFGLDARLGPLLEATIARLMEAGAEVVDLGECPELNRAGDAELEVLLYEFRDGLNAYLATLGPGAKVRTLADVIEFNRAHAPQELAHFGQELFERAQAKGPLTERAYLEARATCLKVTRDEGIDALLARHRLDALVSLTNGPAWLTDLKLGDSYTGGSSSPAAVAGYPSITVPAGEFQGLPVGVSFYGAAWSEVRLLALAADFEAQANARRAPEFLPATRVP